MEGSPRTPSTPRRGTNRLRTSSSPRTPSPMPRSMEPPSAPARRGRVNMSSSPVRQNLNAAFDEAARIAEEDALARQEAEEFHADQDGEEQVVPNSVMYYAAEEPEFSNTWFYCEEDDVTASEEEDDF